MDAWLDVWVNAWDAAHLFLFEHAVQPLAMALGLASVLDVAFEGTIWLMVGLVQLLVMVLGLRWLERWRPVEPVTDVRAVRVDVFYTLIHRLGVVRVGLFFAVDPLWDALAGQLRLWGVPSWHLDAWMAPWWPGVTDAALFAFVVYLLVFDFVDYWFHRSQHRFAWWWALHAVHHSQRQMTLWSDNRNHLLDDVLRDAVMVLVARAIGVPPSQFVLWVACTQLLESLSHANVRLSFGRVGDKLLVSPRFHRLHHAVGLGHESNGVGSMGGHNFAVLFPVWDWVFGSAWKGHLDNAALPPTGIRDQWSEHGGRDYGQGFVAQQMLGLGRMWRVFFKQGHRHKTITLTTGHGEASH